MQSAPWMLLVPAALSGRAARCASTWSATACAMRSTRASADIVPTRGARGAGRSSVSACTFATAGGRGAAPSSDFSLTRRARGVRRRRGRVGRRQEPGVSRRPGTARRRTAAPRGQRALRSARSSSGSASAALDRMRGARIGHGVSGPDDLAHAAPARRRQVAEVLVRHLRLSWRAARARALGAARAGAADRPARRACASIRTSSRAACASGS